MDVLSAGPERARPPRRRWVAAVVAVAVAGAAVVLAGRSTADRRAAVPAPAPARTAAAERPAPASAVVAIAAGRRWAYALVTRCQDDTCGYDLRRRALAGGGWFPTALRTTREDGANLGPYLHADGDVVTVVDRPDSGMVYVSTDGGATVRARPLRAAAPVPAVPAGGLLDLALCESCARRLTVLSPLDGGLHELATQPPVGPEGFRSVSAAGPAIWVVSAGARGEVLTAVSADAGRSWRAVPARGFPTGVDNLRVTAGPDGAAYLFGARTSPAGPGPLAEVWHADGPGGTWRRLSRASGPRGPIAVVPDGPDAVLTDYLGQVWRLRPDGTVARLPDAAVAGRSIGPGLVVPAPGGLLLGLPVDDLRELVFVSTDRGRSWAVEDVTG